jgi:allophanate hydrolase
MSAKITSCPFAGKYVATDVFKDQTIVREQSAKCLASMNAKGVDVLVVPTVMHHYLVDELLAAEKAGPPFTYNAHLGTFTNFVNLMGMCAISIPCGMLASENDSVRACAHMPTAASVSPSTSGK